MNATPRKDTRCVVLSCPANRAEQGCTCDYAYFGNECHHPQYRQQWHDRGAFYPHLEPEHAPDQEHQSLTTKVSAARRDDGRGLTPKAARAKIKQLEMELGDIR